MLRMAARGKCPNGSLTGRRSDQHRRLFVADPSLLVHGL
jgi:hypothetical protein